MTNHEPKHPYVPHPKFPWFCEKCGYAEHEKLKHPTADATNLIARIEAADGPSVRVRKDWRGRWGVQVKWPRTRRSGDWTKTQLCPRWVWHGPFGFDDFRYSDRSAAEKAAEGFRACVAAALKARSE